MQTGAAGTADVESTDHISTIRWVKRVLLLVVILFVPYGFYADLLPELEIRSGASVVWNYYGRMSSYPQKGLFFFDNPFAVVGTLILCIPGFIFLHFLDNRPMNKSAKRMALVTVVVTLLLEHLLAAGYVFLGGPSWMLLLPPFSLTLPILALTIAPLIRWETNRISGRLTPHRSDPASVTPTSGKELDPGRVGMTMFGLALLAPQQVVGLIGFAGVTWTFGLTLSYDAEVWFFIYPFELVLGLSLIYGLGFVFAHRVWLCSMGDAGEGTTVMVGILSLLATLCISILSSPFGGLSMAAPFPLLFLTGLYIVYRCRQIAAPSE